MCSQPVTITTLLLKYKNYVFTNSNNYNVVIEVQELHVHNQ